MDTCSGPDNDSVYLTKCLFNSEYEVYSKIHGKKKSKLLIYLLRDTSRYFIGDVYSYKLCYPEKKYFTYILILVSRILTKFILLLTRHIPYIRDIFEKYQSKIFEIAIMERERINRIQLNENNKK